MRKRNGNSFPIQSYSPTFRSFLFIFFSYYSECSFIPNDLLYSDNIIFLKSFLYVVVIVLRVMEFEEPAK